jgi:hypothetical protein
MICRYLLIERAEKLNWANSISQPLSQVPTLTKPTNKNNSFDFIITALYSRDLSLDKFDDFVDDGIKRFLHVFNRDDDIATRDASSNIVASTCRWEIPFFVLITGILELSFGILLKMLQNLMLSDVGKTRICTEAFHDHLLKNAVDECASALTTTWDSALLYFEGLELLQSIGDQINRPTADKVVALAYNYV